VTKEAVKQYWDSEPCGTRGIPYPVGSLAYYETIAERRDRLVPFIAEYAQFEKWKGKNVLEVGCGVGSDLIKFAQAGAHVTGIDLSPKSVFLARERLRLYRCGGTVDEGDAEAMPYGDGVFDFSYCMGVLHHTPNIEKAIGEIYRVLKPGGSVCAMLYHKPSLVALQMYLAFGLFRLRPFRGIDDILANHHESVGTRAYTIKEAYQMFSAFRNVSVDTRITPYDLRYWRDRYLPLGIGRLLPQRFGWNLIVQGMKP
jgi:ubiquinone/menaquinone biosynthesis C-methylase UbiE